MAKGGEYEAGRAGAEALLAGHEAARDPSLFDLVPVPMLLVLDRECRTVRPNAAFRRLAGLDFVEHCVATQLDWRMEHDGHPVAPEDLPLARAAAAGVSINNASCELTLADGRTLKVIVSANPLRDDQGYPCGAIAVVLDVTEGHRLAGELEEREEWLRMAQAAGSVGVYDWNIAAGEVKGSPELESLYGLPEGSFQGNMDEWKTRVHPADADRVDAYLQHAMVEGRRDVNYVFRVILPDGRVRWLEGKGRVEYGEDGSPLRVVGVNIDITEKQEATEAMEEALRQLTAFTNAAPLGVALLDEKMRYLRVNPALAEMKGIAAEQHIGRTVGQVMPGFATRADQAFRRVMETGMPVMDSILVGATPKDPDSVRNWKGIWFPVPGGDGRPPRVGMLVEDVTEQLSLQEALRRSEERLRLSVEATGMGSYDLDLQRRALLCSRRLQEILGLPTGGSGELSLDQVRARLHPDDLARVEALFRASLDTEGEGEISTEFRVRTGREEESRWVLLRGRTQFRGGESALRVPQRALGMVLDITATKRVQEERTALLERERAARTEAEHASRLKEEFLATVSHELRTPLSAITAWAHLLKMVPGDAEQTAMGADVIESSARAQAQLITDLLDMSRIVSGQMRLEIQDLDIRQIILEVVESLRPAAQGRQIRLRHSLADVDGPTRADPARIRQVLWNLLSNAIKFTPKGGRVHVGLASAGGELRVWVEDSGRGFPRDAGPFLFERFRQLDAGDGSVRKGLGLGLSIVKELVEMHGGQVSAHSEGEGLGARFEVVLPGRAQEDIGQSGTWIRPASFERLKDAEPVLDLAGLRVLVVDDHAETLEVVGRLLRQGGAHVVLASQADEAETLARREPLDVLICDIGLPGRDGYQLIHSVRNAGIRTPAAALTAFARAEDRARALKAGFDAHIAKPVEPGELVSTVADLARRSGKD